MHVSTTPRRPPATRRQVRPERRRPRSADVGQPWTYYEIDSELASSNGASSTCLSNQALHNQSEDLDRTRRSPAGHAGYGPGRDPALFDRRSMVDWAAHVNVPVFLSGALQDEQTGPQWPALIDAVPEDHTALRQHGQRWTHRFGRSPDDQSWLEFLDLYVADKVPTQPNAIGRPVLDNFASTAASVSAQAPLPALRFTTAPDLATARSEFVAQTPRVQALFDNGAELRRARRHRVHLQRGLLQLAPGRHGHDPLSRFRTGHSSRSRRRRAVRVSRWTPRSGPRPACRRAGTPGRPIPAGTGRPFRRPTASRSRQRRSPRPTTVAGPATLSLWVKAAGASRRTSRPRSPRCNRRRAGGIRHLGLPAQLEPGRRARFHGALHGSDLSGSQARSLSPVPLLARQDPDRPDRAHLPARHRTTSRDLGARWGPAGLDLRHRRQRSAGNGRLRGRHALGPDSQRRPRRQRHRLPSAVWFATRRALPGLSARGQPAVELLLSSLDQRGRRRRRARSAA